MFGVIPKRYNVAAGQETDIDTYFAMARGTKEAVACELTKWFDTNYHYLVPELTGNFTITENKPLNSYKLAKEKLNIETKPVILGPFTYIYLGKVLDEKTGGFVKSTESPKFNSLVQELAKKYNTILKECKDAGVKTVQLDEPALVMDLTDSELDSCIEAYNNLTTGLEGLDIHVQTYYESISNYKKIVENLPVQGIGLDFLSNPENLDNLTSQKFPSDKTLIAGVIDGRSLWKTDYKKTVALVNKIKSVVSEDNLIISNSAPLFHLPVSTNPEKGHLDANVLSLIAFAEERLEELKTLKNILQGNQEIKEQNLDDIRKKFDNQAVQARRAALNENEIGRKTAFEQRYKEQMDILSLPKFPTTTIGSFPQTAELRKTRADWKAGKLPNADYENYINTYIKDIVKLQEDLNIDVLVHGEPERTDMVEFFGQRMNGFAFTKKGWVQSYGSRCVRPPIIYGDVSRPKAMTVKEVTYAQSLTDKTMKGMLTGPVTILNWSFYRKDISKKEIAYQIALGLEDEVTDLEKAGIKIIQIDEPAFREGLPLKSSKQKAYLKWAVDAFKLSHNNVMDKTQIHTHMCYSEFNEIIESIQAMDADVISIETSRSKGEILDVFEKFNYNLGIGLGVYDIHSPRVPELQEMQDIADRSVKSISKDLIWINPDCGLKTRGFPETKEALKNMVTVAENMRKKY